MSRPAFKEYRQAGDDFIYYGKDEVDDYIAAISVQHQVSAESNDELYKQVCALVARLDTAKSSRKKLSTSC